MVLYNKEKKKGENMRIDKFLTECGLGSRREVKRIIEKGDIKVNGEKVKSAETKINEIKDEVTYLNEKLEYKKYRYYIMNKKSGYITASKDLREKTVMELLPEWIVKKDLVPVGRLDKDTEGLLLFTNNGKLGHFLLSPKNHVKKTYFVRLEFDITPESVQQLKTGVDIGVCVTQPAEVAVFNAREIYLTICEGKFHQVKKMIEKVNNKVSYLRRDKFGNLDLKKFNLNLGEVIEITLDEIL